MDENQLNENENLPSDESGSGESKNLKPKYSPVTAAFLGLIAVFVLYQLGGSLLTFLIFGMKLKSADVTSMRLLTTAGQLLFILLPALILARAVYPDVNKIIRIKIPRVSELFFFSVGLFILAALLQNYLYIQNFIIVKIAEVSPLFNKAKIFFDEIDKIVERAYAELLAYNSVYEASFIVFVVAIVPAVCEETFFRGFVQRSFEHKLKPLSSAFITAIFFGVYHFHPYQVVPLTILGLYFGFASYKTRTILVPMLLHFLNNFIALILFFILGSDQINTPVNVSFTDLKISLISFIGLTVLFCLLLLYLNKFYYKLDSADEKELN